MPDARMAGGCADTACAPRGSSAVRIHCAETETLKAPTVQHVRKLLVAS
jgi:hypothetical protein